MTRQRASRKSRRGMINQLGRRRNGQSGRAMIIPKNAEKGEINPAASRLLTEGPLEKAAGRVREEASSPALLREPNRRKVRA